MTSMWLRFNGIFGRSLFVLCWSCDGWGGTALPLLPRLECFPSRASLGLFALQPPLVATCPLISYGGGSKPGGKGRIKGAGSREQISQQPGEHGVYCLCRDRPREEGKK